MWTSSPAMMARRCGFGARASITITLCARSCGYAIESTGSSAERWAGALAERHGYAIAHTPEVSGLCPDCSSAFLATR